LRRPKHICCFPCYADVRDSVGRAENDPIGPHVVHDFHHSLNLSDVDRVNVARDQQLLSFAAGKRVFKQIFDNRVEIKPTKFFVCFWSSGIQGANDSRHRDTQESCLSSLCEHSAIGCRAHMDVR
jgi:hypothetical protein